LHTSIVENLVFARNPDRFPGDFAFTLVPEGAWEHEVTML